VYISAFGISFFSNLAVVVTHWEMSNRANKQRERAGITKESFQNAWVEELRQRIDLSSCDHSIPFIFLDNNHDPEDEVEAQIFIDSKHAIYEDACVNPLFPCVHLNSDPLIRKRLEEQANTMGLDQCDQCGRYFVRSTSEVLDKTSTVSSTAAASTQTAIGATRIYRVMEATKVAWTPEILTKAMTRGWHGRTGVHLAGKAVATGGIVLQVAVGAIRLYKAKTTTQAAQAVVGTGASIVGGYQGATLGASLGTALFPGIGTVIGGIMGGLLGSVGAQVVSEAAIGGVGYLKERVDGKLCMACKQV